MLYVHVIFLKAPNVPVDCNVHCTTCLGGLQLSTVSHLEFSSKAQIPVLRLQSQSSGSNSSLRAEILYLGAKTRRNSPYMKA